MAYGTRIWQRHRPREVVFVLRGTANKHNPVHKGGLGLTPGRREPPERPGRINETVSGVPGRFQLRWLRPGRSEGSRREDMNMKASEYVAKLQDAIDEFGDLEIVDAYNTDPSDIEEVEGVLVFADTA